MTEKTLPGAGMSDEKIHPSLLDYEKVSKASDANSTCRNVIHRKTPLVPMACELANIWDKTGEMGSKVAKMECELAKTGSEMVKVRSDLAEFGSEMAKESGDLVEIGSEAEMKLVMDEKNLAKVDSSSAILNVNIEEPNITPAEQNLAPADFVPLDLALSKSAIADSYAGDIPSSLAPSPVFENCKIDRQFEISSSLDLQSEMSEAKERYATLMVSAHNIREGESSLIHLFYEPGQQAQAPVSLGNRLGLEFRTENDQDVFDVTLVDISGNELPLKFTAQEDEEWLLQHIPSLLVPNMDFERERAGWAFIDNEQYSKICDINLNNTLQKRPDYTISAFDLPFAYEERLQVF